jgi:hypothetical protein
MLDWRDGLSADESADRQHISPRSVERLRQGGRRIVLEFWETDADGGDCCDSGQL